MHLFFKVKSFFKIIHWFIYETHLKFCLNTGLIEKNENIILNGEPNDVEFNLIFLINRMNTYFK